MELLVCIKQVPDDSVTVTLDTATGGPQLKAADFNTSYQITDHGNQKHHHQRIR